MSELAGAKLLTFCRLQCSQEAASKPFSTTKYRGIWRRLYKVKLFFQAIVNSYSLSNTETLYRYSWGNQSQKQLLLMKQQSRRLKWHSHHHSYFFDRGSWVMTANKSARKCGAEFLFCLLNLLLFYIYFLISFIIVIVEWCYYAK